LKKLQKISSGSFLTAPKPNLVSVQKEWCYCGGLLSIFIYLPNDRTIKIIIIITNPIFFLNPWWAEV
jgi:hypothetical protein